MHIRRREDAATPLIRAAALLLRASEAKGKRSQLLLRKAEALRKRKPFPRAFLVSGHMIDRPGRKPPRFPPERESWVAEQMAKALDAWKAGPGDLAIAGGACGADIIFEELCSSLKMKVMQLLPLPPREFVDSSVRPAGNGWVRRFESLCEACETLIQSEQLGPPPPDVDVFHRNNLWIRELARTLAPQKQMRTILVWDGSPGDGPGGTSDFARLLARKGLTKIIKPMSKKHAR